MTTPTEKIVVVSGQEFRVPAEASDEAIRAQLRLNFPDVANATVKHSTRTIDGVEYQAIEFVKQAGTKGGRDAWEKVYQEINNPDEIDALVEELRASEGLSELDALRQASGRMMRLAYIAADWDECAAAERARTTEVRR